MISRDKERTLSILKSVLELFKQNNFILTILSKLRDKRKEHTKPIPIVQVVQVVC